MPPTNSMLTPNQTFSARLAGNLTHASIAALPGFERKPLKVRLVENATVEVYGCYDDSDCDNLDNLYCDGSVSTTVEGVCVSHVCEADVIDTEECDTGRYCFIGDHCDVLSGVCVVGTARSCAAYDISEVNDCSNDPDNNDFTYDYRALFESLCNEDEDRCETGDYSRGIFRR